MFLHIEKLINVKIILKSNEGYIFFYLSSYLYFGITFQVNMFIYRRFDSPWNNEMVTLSRC